MGLLDDSSKKDIPPQKPLKGQEDTAPAQKSKTAPLNQREDIRYAIEEIPVENIGRITEISRNGLKIKKYENCQLTAGEPVKTKIDVYPITAAVAWESGADIGLKFKGDQELKRFIKPILKKNDEDTVTHPKTLSLEKISQYSQNDVLTPLVHLMAELETKQTDLKRLRQYITEVHELHKKSHELWQKEKEKLEQAGAENEGKEIKTKVLPDLKEELRRKAFGSAELTGINESDVDCIINRLGLQAVKQISSQFIKKNRPDSADLLPKFKNYQAFDALKTVLMSRLSRLFGFQLDVVDCISLLSLEICGLKIFMQYSGRDLSSYYSSATKIYSDNMRRFEYVLLGMDYLQAGKIYFEKVVGSFQGIYDGYILGHLLLNPHYRLTPAVKLSLTKNKLAFGFMAYLIFLAARFILDQDRESGYILISKLRRAGLPQGKALDFINNCISESNSILSDMGIRGSIPTVSFSGSAFALDRYLPKHPQFDFLLKGFGDLDSGKIKRLAVACEDTVYAHFITDKIMTSGSFGFASKVHCVIPCENITDDELYLDNFLNFDLLIFENINKLSLFHKKAFLKLWSSFEGKIIVTINSQSMFDFDNAELYRAMKDCVINFPSCIGSRELYKKMLDHVELHLKPFINMEMDKSCYADGLFTMEHVRTSELLVVMYQ